MSRVGRMRWKVILPVAVGAVVGLSARAASLERSPASPPAPIPLGPLAPEIVRKAMRGDFSIPSLPPDETAARIEALLQNGEQDAAEGILGDAVARHPDHPRLLFLLGACTRSRFNVSDAAQVFAALADRAPATKEGLCAALVLRMDADHEVERSFDALRLLVEMHPSDPVLLWMLAVQCRAKNSNHEGVHCYRRLARMWRPGPVLLHQTYANLLEFIGSSEAALGERETAVSMERETWSVDSMASTLAALGRYDEAERLYREVLKADPRNVGVWGNLGFCLKRARRFEDAIAVFKENLRRDPGSVRPQTGWIECLLFLDRPEEAREKCIALRESGKRDPWTENVLEYLEWQLNRKADGKPMFVAPTSAELAARSPGNPKDREAAGRALVDAASVGDRAAVAALLAWGAPIGSTNEHGCTALHHAAEYGHAAVVADLLKAGADVEARNQWRQTPLYVISHWTNPRSLECARLLLAAGADPNTEAAVGSALRFALTTGNHALADLLLKAGGSADGGRAPNGATPLARSCGRSETAVARWFLAHGADPNAQDREGRTPLMYTVLTPLMATPESWAPDLVALLIRAQADPNLEGKDGATALDWAALVGHAEAVDFLARHGATRTQPRFPRWQPAPNLGEDDRFALACEASLLCATGGRLGILGGLAGKQPATRQLKEYWGCGGARMLRERLDGLRLDAAVAPAGGGKKPSAAPMPDPAEDPAGWVLAETAKRYRETGLPGRTGVKAPADPAAPRVAWDAVECLHLSALGRTAEWLPDDEAGRRIAAARKRIAATFDSWAEFGAALEAGQRLFRPRDTRRYELIFSRLNDRQDPDNPWVKTPWPKTNGP